MPESVLKLNMIVLVISPLDCVQWQKKQDDGLMKFGYINSSNQLVIPFKYDSASVFQDNKAYVNDNGITYTIDLNGNILSSYIKEDYHEDNEDDGWFGYTPEELEEMYREAMGANSTNEWNID